KIRARSKSFLDHYSQVILFFNSQSEPEKQHIIDAFKFEMDKVKTVAIRERMLTVLDMIDEKLAAEVVDALGLKIPNGPKPPINYGRPADASGADYQTVIVKSSLKKSEALSMSKTRKDSIKTRKIAFLAADGVAADSLNTVKKALE